jgi:hypothetical protein
MKRWRLAAAAALSVGAAGCADRPLDIGGEPSHMSHPPSTADYGPALIFRDVDLNSPNDGGTD